MPDSKETREELERGKIELKIQALKGQVMAQYERTSIKLDESIKIGKATLIQAEKTNGRMDRAEVTIIELKDSTDEKIDAIDKATATAIEKIFEKIFEIFENLEIIDLLRRKKWLVFVLAWVTIQIYQAMEIGITWVFNKLISFF